MGLNLQLIATDVAPGTQFPGTMAALGTLIAEYLAVAGDEDFIGVNWGVSEPAEADRDKPWFRMLSTTNPIGWFAWDGAQWTQLIASIPSGALASAGTGVVEGQLYDATDGAGLCVWSGGAWITADGRSGEVRFVRGTKIADILAKFPGWAQITEDEGRAYGVAGDAGSFGFSGRSAGAIVGAETHTNTIAEMVSHDHKPVMSARVSWANGRGTSVVGSTTGSVGPKTILTDIEEGGGQPFSIMNPTWYLFAIKKL